MKWSMRLSSRCRSLSISVGEKTGWPPRWIDLDSINSISDEGHESVSLSSSHLATCLAIRRTDIREQRLAIRVIVIISRCQTGASSQWSNWPPALLYVRHSPTATMVQNDRFPTPPPPFRSTFDDPQPTRIHADRATDRRRDHRSSGGHRDPEISEHEGQGVFRRHAQRSAQSDDCTGSVFLRPLEIH